MMKMPGFWIAGISFFALLALELRAKRQHHRRSKLQPFTVASIASAFVAWYELIVRWFGDDLVLVNRSRAD